MIRIHWMTFTANDMLNRIFHGRRESLQSTLRGSRFVSNLETVGLATGALVALLGHCVPRRGQGLPPLSAHSFSLRQVFLDEAEHFLRNRDASVATLRGCSGSSRNAVRLPSGTSVRLRRNPQDLSGMPLKDA